MARIAVWLLLAALFAGPARSQEPQAVSGRDPRYRADILVVVAHPDDEGAVTPFLARAIYDLHKRVAVVFLTRGGSGGNDAYREHGPALSAVREIEARQACAALGITNVWFLTGKDTASQNVLNSLANWGHGENLEALVRIVRLTRPEIMLTWLPAVFIGENHGDHQAAGVLATESFDLAGDPVAFPAQVAGASKRLEPYLENLAVWQPKKLYYFSDATDDKRFAGSGPSYSVREISPSQKKPYWRLALDAAKPHYTQFPKDIDRISKLTDAQLEKVMSDPNAGWWTEPETLIFGKSAVNTKPADDLFAGLDHALEPGRADAPPAENQTALRLEGPWGYYQAFRTRHNLRDYGRGNPPELAVRTGSVVLVPLGLAFPDAAPRRVNVKVEVPQGWKVTAGEGDFMLPAENHVALQVEIETPKLPAEELKKAAPVEIVVRAAAGELSLGEVRLRVLLRASALPQ